MSPISHLKMEQDQDIDADDIRTRKRQRNMADWTIDEWVDATAEKEPVIINDYAGSIDFGVYQLGAFMRDLEPYLAHETDLIRVARALKILAPVLSAIQAIPGRADVHVLVEYLSARLENKDKVPNHRAGIREVTAALQVLITWRTFPPGDAATIASAINAMCEEYTFKDQALATRLDLFKFADELVKQHERPLRRDMKDEGVVNWINAMALAEKNLSCLVVLFPLYAYISKNWNLAEKELEACWDSFIRYFPISIGNPTKDPTVPSQERLRELLLECIVSNDKYATKAFTRLIDNLDTESDLSANTKKEVFATLVACIQNYSPAVVDQWTIKIWDALKFEVWNGDNTDFIDGSLNVLGAIAKALPDVPPAFDKTGSPINPPPYEEWTDTKDPKSSYVSHAANECKTRIMDSRRQYLQPSARILKALASATPYSFHLVTSSVLPALFVLWQDITLDSEKKMLLEMFNGILEARLTHVNPVLRVDGHHFASDNNANQYTSRNSRGTEALKGTFAKFKDNFTGIYLDLIPEFKVLDDKDVDKDTTVAAATIRGLSLLYKVPEYFTESEKVRVVSEMSATVLDEHAPKDIRQYTMEALQRVSASDPDVYQKTTLEFFTAKLPKSLSPSDPERATHMALINKILNTLVQISCSMPCLKENGMGRPAVSGSSFWHRNFDATMFKLLWILDEAMQHKGQTSYLQAIIITISTGLAKFDQSLDTARTVMDEPYFHGLGPYTWIVKRLFKLISQQKTSNDGATYIGIANVPSTDTPFDDRIVDQMGNLVMVALRSVRSRVPHVSEIDTALASPAPYKPLYDFVRIAHGEDSSKTRNARRNNEPIPSQPSTIWTLFTTGGDLNAIAASQFQLDQAPEDKFLANLLSMYLLAGFFVNDMEVKQGIKDVLHFDPGMVASAIIKSATTTQPIKSPLARMSMLWTLQLLVNKYRAADTFPLYDDMLSQLSSIETKSEIEIRYTLQTLAYVAAASLAAMQPASTKLIKLMLAGVSDPEYGRYQAQNFKILLAPSHILNAKNFCNLRPLRFAKAFNLVFEPLRAMWSAGDRKTKDNALIALAGVLEFVDVKVYSEPDAAASLLPLVLDGTNIKNIPATRVVFIKTLNSLVAERPELVEEYLKSIIARMTDRTESDVASRGLALDVLGSIIRKLPGSAVLREKALLTKELNALLGDGAREVREKAQRCKTALLCLDEPKDE